VHLSLHGMRDSRVVACQELTDPIPSLVDRGIFTTATATQQGLQWGTSSPVRLCPPDSFPSLRTWRIVPGYVGAHLAVLIGGGSLAATAAAQRRVSDRLTSVMPVREPSSLRYGRSTATLAGATRHVTSIHQPKEM
jgi:hypothetical protein